MKLIYLVWRLNSSLRSGQLEASDGVCFMAFLGDWVFAMALISHRVEITLIIHLRQGFLSNTGKLIYWAEQRPTCVLIILSTS